MRNKNRGPRGEARLRAYPLVKYKMKKFAKILFSEISNKYKIITMKYYLNVYLNFY